MTSCRDLPATRYGLSRTARAYVEALDAYNYGTGSWAQVERRRHKLVQSALRYDAQPHRRGGIWAGHYPYHHMQRGKAEMNWKEFKSRVVSINLAKVPDDAQVNVAVYGSDIVLFGSTCDIKWLDEKNILLEVDLKTKENKS